MPNRSVEIHGGLFVALCVLSLGACAQEQEAFIPATSFAESFAPFEVLSSVAEREGLAPVIRHRGAHCSKGSGGPVGGPTTTSVACRGQVEVRSREDGARLTRAVFAELEQMAYAHWGIGRPPGSPGDGELHLRHCSDDTERAVEPAFRGCMFLHFLAFESQGGAGPRSITYFFSLDEERSKAPTVEVAAAR